MQKNNLLFRSEVVDYKQGTWLGDVLLTRPTSFAVISLLFFVLALSTLAFLVWGEYTKKARVAGYLVPEHGLIKIFVAQSSQVTKLLVQEGQVVKRGDTLLVVSTERSNAQGKTQEALAKQLLLRRVSLEEETAKVSQLYNEQIHSATARLARLNEESAELQRAFDAQRQRVALSEQVVERNRQLFTQQYVSEAALQDKRADLLDQQNRLRELLRTQSTQQREAMALQSELNNLPLKARSEQAALTRGVAEIAGAAIENEARREEYILAPQDGMVTALQTNIGKQATAFQPLMSLIPAGTRLQADLYVPSRSIGFVRVGNVARVQYQAFPYQKFGSHTGKVTKISRTAVPSQELPFPAASTDFYYVVTVVPEFDHVVAYGKKEPLQTGMHVDADIWLDRRTLLEWILEPLFSVSGRM